MRILFHKLMNNVLTTKKLKYLNHYIMVHPCVIKGEPALVYPRGLKNRDSASYQKLVDYAISRNLQLKEDQRSDFLEGIRRVKNKRSANLVPIMFLGASLLTQNLFAGTSDNSQNHEDTASTSEIHQVDTLGDLSNMADEQGKLMIELLNWINSHSSFYYMQDNLPEVKKVTTRKIALIAFGKSLPKAVDLNTLKIFGLYNFNEKTIYLHDSVNLETEKGKAILLHELVHFLQYQYGHDKNASCKNELESLAYMLEARFLHDHNQQVMFDNQAINQISQCKAVVERV